MRFGPVPLSLALGGVLAHSVAGLRKGQVLDEAALLGLGQAGLTEVIVAQLDSDEIGEDAAALRLAGALVGPGLRAGAASTGRVNLLAEGTGLFWAEGAAVAAVNGINPLITLATLAPYSRVQAGTMVATVKIIAYGVPEADVERAAQMAVQTAAGGVMRVAPPLRRRARLIETQVGETPPPQKGRDAVRQRLSRLGLDLAPRVICPHRVEPLARAMAEAMADPTEDLLLVLTASATSDPADVMPEALRRAGGRVERFGMPVDPGNLLVLGCIANRPVIGLPGCARSPALNGADWVMERLICGFPVTSADIGGMGLGGLLKEPPSRPRSRLES